MAADDQPLSLLSVTGEVGEWGMKGQLKKRNAAADVRLRLYLEVT